MEIQITCDTYTPLPRPRRRHASLVATAPEIQRSPSLWCSYLADTPTAHTALHPLKQCRVFHTPHWATAPRAGPVQFHSWRHVHVSTPPP